jgi:lipoyl(octanoyl) transferase
VLAPGDIPVLHVDRGGQVTYHGPGQIVVYPLLDLRGWASACAITCAASSRPSSTRWTSGTSAPTPRRHARASVGGAKIASLGMRVRRGCTFHGLAFNVAMDLEPFHRINPAATSACR